LEIDDYKFFREVSVRICGSLEIEKALVSCYEFLRDVMPIDELMLVVYDRELGSSTIKAIASAEGGRSCSEETPLPSCLRREFEEVEQHPRTRKINAFDDPIVSYVARRRHWEESSLLVNRLIVEGKYVGAMVARVKGRDRYTDEHLRLWALVNEPSAVALANNQQYREISRLKDLLADDKSYLEQELRKRTGARLVGAEFGLKRVMEGVRLVAPLTSPVLISGQTGTGKELIANAIHDLSPRRDGPLIRVNCGAIPETLIDSELFGHEKGAFTGAYEQKRGRFERANKGTIFLDEVSELPPAAQVRLLRVLQEKEIERVGGGIPIKVDVRIISATNRRLPDLVARGLFREDLFFRLNVFPIHIPPLRERKTDMPALVHHFIEKKGRQMALATVPALAPGEIDKLMDYDWPGNVRELENAVERSIIVSGGKMLTFGDILGASPGRTEETGQSEEIPATLREGEAKQIRRALEKAHGKVSGKGSAAEILGINSGTLRHRMRKLGIPFGRKNRNAA
jgi:transcriptional regulator with GAF, ATPase, and Fis domain